MTLPVICLKIVILFNTIAKLKIIYYHEEHEEHEVVFNQYLTLLLGQIDLK